MRGRDDAFASIDTQDEAAAARRRAETRAARKIVQVCLAVLVAGTLAAAMRTHGAPEAARSIGRLAVYELLAIGTVGFLAVRVPQPTLRLVWIVFVVLLTAASVGTAILIAAAG